MSKGKKKKWKKKKGMFNDEICCLLVSTFCVSTPIHLSYNLLIKRFFLHRQGKEEQKEEEQQEE